MNFEKDLSDFLNNTLNKLESVEKIIKLKQEEINRLNEKLKYYQEQELKLKKADLILEEAKNNADHIIDSALTIIKKNN